MTIDLQTIIEHAIHLVNFARLVVAPEKIDTRGVLDLKKCKVGERLNRAVASINIIAKE